MTESVFEARLREQLSELAGHARATIVDAPSADLLPTDGHTSASGGDPRWPRAATVMAAAAVVVIGIVGVALTAGRSDTTVATEPADTDRPAEGDVGEDGDDVGRVDQPSVDLRVLALRAQPAAAAVLDLAEATDDIYPRTGDGVGVGDFDATQGLVSPTGQAVLWNGGSIEIYPGIDLSETPAVVDVPAVVDDGAADLWVIPTSDGLGLWFVEPGECCTGQETRTRASLMSISDRVVTFEAAIDGVAWPAATSSDMLALDTVVYEEGTDGWFPVEGSETVITISPDGDESTHGPGSALAIADDVMAVLEPDGTLRLRDLATEEDVVVAAEPGARWMDPGGPLNPGSWPGLRTLSGDGLLLLGSSVDDGDGTFGPTDLVTVDVTSGEVELVATFDAGLQLAGWSSDDAEIGVVNANRLTVIGRDGRTLVDEVVIPDDFVVVGLD